MLPLTQTPGSGHENSVRAWEHKLMAILILPPGMDQVCILSRW
jgi:hypothetical protein